MISVREDIKSDGVGVRKCTACSGQPQVSEVAGSRNQGRDRQERQEGVRSPRRSEKALESRGARPAEDWKSPSMISTLLPLKEALTYPPHKVVHG